MKYLFSLKTSTLNNSQRNSLQVNCLRKKTKVLTGVTFTIKKKLRFITTGCVSDELSISPNIIFHWIKKKLADSTPYTSLSIRSAGFVSDLLDCSSSELIWTQSVRNYRVSFFSSFFFFFFCFLFFSMTRNLFTLSLSGFRIENSDLVFLHFMGYYLKFV